MTSAPQPCFHHPATPAAHHCARCGKPICEVCTRKLNSAPHCEACAADRESQSPLLAAVLSLLCPGMGQLYNGDWGKAAAVFLSGWLVAPWVWGVVDAARTADAILHGERSQPTVGAGYVILAMKLGAMGLAVVYGLFGWTLVGLLVGRAASLR